MKFKKPRIVVSKCLEFEACRYDGQLINNKYIKNLKKFIDFIPVCPEVEIGMGIPRDTIRIIENKKERLLFQPETGNDFSEVMDNFSKKYLNTLSNIDGFILKTDSPSCGVFSAKIYPKRFDSPPDGRSSGFFARHVLSLFPNHPTEEEKRLNNIFIREHFYTSIFTIADFKNVDSFHLLYKYHTKHKYLFMSYNQTLMKKMGDVAANRFKNNFDSVLDNYKKLLLILFKKKSRYPSNINTHMHVMGYFKDKLSYKEKKHFLDTLDEYRDKKIPISSINAVLVSWINRFENEYLMNQSFFNPFPKEIIEKEKSRFQ